LQERKQKICIKKIEKRRRMFTISLNCDSGSAKREPGVSNSLATPWSSTRILRGEERRGQDEWRGERREGGEEG